MGQDPIADRSRRGAEILSVVDERRLAAGGWRDAVGGLVAEQGRDLLRGQGR